MSSALLAATKGVWRVTSALLEVTKGVVYGLCPTGGNQGRGV